MSEDNSNLDKDLSKRPKKRGGGPAPANTDYRPPKKGPPKEHQPYYDSKGYEKPTKDQYNSNKGTYNSGYDDYDYRGPKHDNYSYKPRGYPRHQTRQGPEHGSNAWKKKANKIAREAILETSSRVAPHKEVEDWLSKYKELFVKEQQAPVNDEVFQLDPNDGFMPKGNRGPGGGNYRDNEGPQEGEPEEASTGTSASASASGNNEKNNKGFQMFDFAQERHDPIQALKEKMREQEKSKDPNKSQKQEEELGGSGSLEDKKTMEKDSGKRHEGESKHGNDEKLEKGDKELQDDDGEKYSDIDTEFENKLKNNEIPETYEDVFEELLGRTGNKLQNNTKNKLVDLEDSARPEWEDVDTKKVIEDIKKEDFLTNLTTQDKRVLFGAKYGTPDQKDQFNKPVQNNSVESQKSQERSSFKDSGIDFSKLNFEMDIKASSDDFPIKHEDLFPTNFTKNVAVQKPGVIPGQEGVNPALQNLAGYGPSMMQQGNMARGMPQPVHPMQLQQMQQMQYMQPMHQMSHLGPMNQIPTAMGQMGQINQMDPMNPKYSAYGNQGYMLNQQAGLKQNIPSANFQRPQPAPTGIFKYFSPNYEEKIWYYIDIHTKIQGPFSGKTMDEWYLNGHLPLTLQVTIGRTNVFKTLKELLDTVLSRTMPSPTMGPYPHSEPQVQPMGHPQAPQTYAGISDLLKNRPDLVQYAPNVQQTMLGTKTKTLDEVEKTGGNFPGQYQQYQRIASPGYPEYQANVPPGDYPGGYPNPNMYQRGGPPQNYGEYYNEGNMSYPEQNSMVQKMSYGGMNKDSPNRIVDPSIRNNLSPGEQNIKPVSNTSTAGTPSSTSTGSTPIDSSRDAREAREAMGSGPDIVVRASRAKSNSGNANMLEKPVSVQQTSVSVGGATNSTSGSAPAMPIQNLLGALGGGHPNDMTLQLKNLLGLTGGNIGAPVVGNVPTQKVQQEEVQQEKQLEKPQPQPQAQPQALTQQQFREKSGNYNYGLGNQEKQQQQQQQNQNQKKGVKAPKIDTSDFPSLTETYK